jgi:hypothetical protein
LAEEFYIKTAQRAQIPLCYSCSELMLSIPCRGRASTRPSKRSESRFRPLHL